MSNKITYIFEFNDQGKVKVNDLTKGFVKLETAMKKVTAESAAQAAASSKANAALGNTISNAGLAGAVLTEFGRTISDSNYGIRGMANNLSQLSTLLITFIGKQEQSGIRGVISAFRGLGQQLMGPLGLILAFQVVVALIEKFSMEADKAASAAKSFNGSLVENKQLLSDINVLLQKTNTSLSERNDVTDAVSAKEKGLAKAIEERNLNEEQANELTSKFVALKLEESELLEKSKGQYEELQELDIRQSDIDEGRIKTKARLEKVNKTLLNLRDQDLSLVGDLIRQYQVEKLALDKQLTGYTDSEDKLKELTKTLSAYGLKQKEITALLKVDKEERKKAIKELEDTTPKAIDLDVGIESVLRNFYDYDKLSEEMEKNLPDFIDDIDEFVDNQLLTAGRVSLTEKLLGLEEASAEKDIKALRAKFDPILYETEEFLKLEEAIRKKYADKKRETQDEVDKAESKARFDHWNELAKGFASFMNNLALLNEGNKDLARASIIASAAATSVGIWEAWLVKDPTFSPAPAKVAGAIATQAAVIASTAAALKSLNTNTPIGGAGSAATGSSASPQFNVVGQEVGQMGQLASAITGQTGEPIRAYVVLDDVNSAAELDNKITTSGSIG